MCILSGNEFIFSVFIFNSRMHRPMDEFPRLYFKICSLNNSVSIFRVTLLRCVEDVLSLLIINRETGEVYYRIPHTV